MACFGFAVMCAMLVFWSGLIASNRAPICVAVSLYLWALQVAVVDSGVAKHYDIDSNVWKNLEESDDGKDDDGET